MLGYITIGANDMDRARAFYADLLAMIGASELMRMSDAENGFTLYATGWGQPGIAVTRPHDGKAADPGNNGHMAAIVVDERAKVDALHARALALGGTCEGPPGRSRRRGRAGVLRRLFSGS